MRLQRETILGRPACLGGPLQEPGCIAGVEAQAVAMAIGTLLLNFRPQAKWPSKRVAEANIGEPVAVAQAMYQQCHVVELWRKPAICLRHSGGEQRHREPKSPEQPGE